MNTLLLRLAAALLALATLPTSAAMAQSVAIEQFASQALGTARQIRISLPASYDISPQKRYPLILTFDGEYMFYDTLGAITNLALYEQAPEAIVVSIDQNTPGPAGGRAPRWIE